MEYARSKGRTRYDKKDTKIALTYQTSCPRKHQNLQKKKVIHEQRDLNFKELLTIQDK